MTPRGNQPEQPTQPTQAEKGTETKRRYQSGPTPPKMPHERPKTSSRDQQQDGHADESRDQQQRQDRADAHRSVDREQEQWDREQNNASAANGEADDAQTLDLQRASREQLIERARELEIVGFEELSREELVRRIQEAR
jgi:hypothetical protein